MAQDHAMRSKHDDFIELQAGWKVWVVVPILRSGGYIVPSVKKLADGNTVDVETTDDFVGYEKDFYKITARTGGGIRITFSHAEVREKDKTYATHKPRLSLFTDMPDARMVRLVYLTRVSDADHDMAIVSSSDPEELDEMTRAVTQRGTCQSSRKAFCSWVPNGVAVTAERG